MEVPKLEIKVPTLTEEKEVVMSLNGSTVIGIAHGDVQRGDIIQFAIGDYIVSGC